MSHARREALKAKGQAQADAWNAKYPVGTPVMAYPGVRPEDPVAVCYRQRVEKGRTFGNETDPTESLRTVTRTPAWTLGHGEPVVSVEGYPGGIVLRHVDPIVVSLIRLVDIPTESPADRATRVAHYADVERTIHAHAVEAGLTDDAYMRQSLLIDLHSDYPEFALPTGGAS